MNPFSAGEEILTNVLDVNQASREIWVVTDL